MTRLGLLAFALLTAIASIADAQVKLSARNVDAWTGAETVSVEQTDGGPVIFVEGAIARRQVALIAVESECKHVALKARRSLFERAPLVQLSNGQWLLDAEPGRYAIEATAFDPGLWEDVIEVVIGPSPDPEPEPGPGPGPAPGPDPQPPSPDDPFANLTAAIKPLAARMLPADRLKWQAAFDATWQAMNDFRVKTIPEARAFLSRYPLTCHDLDICRALNQLLADEANRRGSLSWQEAMQYYQAVARGFK